MSEALPPSSIRPADSERFLAQLTGAQSSLYAFICVLLGGSRHAQDVLQETNLVLWKKASQFDPAREFLPWAYTFARLQVMAYRKASGRSRLQFNDQFLEQVAAQASTRNHFLDQRMRALDDCLQKLPQRQRELVCQRYEKGVSVNALAQEVGQSANALAVTLYRIRESLVRCVQNAILAGGGS